MEQSRRNFIKKAAAGTAGTFMFSRLVSGESYTVLTGNKSLFPSSQEDIKFGYFYPKPQVLTEGKGTFRLDKAFFYLSQSFNSADSWILMEFLKEPPRISLLKEEIQTPSVLIGNITNEIIKEQVDKLALRIPEDCLKPGGYILNIRNNLVIIAGADDRGTFYGVQTLRQMVENSTNNLLQCLSIFDWPSLKVRSLHYLHCDDLWRADKTKVNFNEEMGRQVVKSMGQLKMNMIVLTMGNSVQWQSHAEIALPGAWSQDKFREFVQFIKKYHIEIVPEFNLSPCHDSWLGKYHALVGKPVYFQTIQDILSEYIDLLDPKVKTIHLGADEESTYHNENMKLEPKFLRPPAERIEAMARQVRFLESKGIDTMIWADIILSDRPKGRWMWELYDKPDENARLLKEKVIHVEWFPYTHYGNFAITEELVKRGMKTIIAGWYRSEKEAGFPSGVAEKALELKDRNVMGVMQTIWPAGMKTGDKPVYQAAGAFWNPSNPGLNLAQQKEYIKE